MTISLRDDMCLIDIYIPDLMNLKMILFILLVMEIVSCSELGKLVRNYKERHRRRCEHKCHHLPSYKSCGLLKHAYYNIFMVLLFLIIALILILMLLGLIKGLIGLFCAPRIGLLGLNMLLDLPRPLSKYQEKELAHRPVKYDVAGWPVHPDTDLRTVRPITRRTEFCLNIIFFLSYPLALLIRSCATCCMIKNYNDEENMPLLSTTRIIRMTNCCNIFKKKPSKTDPGCCCHPCPGVYSSEKQEAEDTDYVIAMLKKSKESLNEHDCLCDTSPTKKTTKQKPLDPKASDTKYEADDEGDGQKS